MAMHPKLTLASYQGDIPIDMHSIQNGLRYYQVPYNLIFQNPPSQGELDLHFPTWIAGLKETSLFFEGHIDHTGEPLVIRVLPSSPFCVPKALLRLAYFALFNFASPQVSNVALRMMLYHTKPNLPTVGDVQIYAVIIGPNCTVHGATLFMYSDEQLKENLRRIGEMCTEPAAKRLLQLIFEYCDKCNGPVNVNKWRLQGLALQNQVLSLSMLAHPILARSMSTESSLRIALTITLKNPTKNEARDAVKELRTKHVATEHCDQIDQMVELMTYLPPPPDPAHALYIPPPLVIGRQPNCNIL